jgi:hypothetical protein
VCTSLLGTCAGQGNCQQESPGPLPQCATDHAGSSSYPSREADAPISLRDPQSITLSQEAPAVLQSIAQLRTN